MAPFVTAKDNTFSDTTTIANAAAAHIAKPDLSYLPTFNVAGGRPDERCGTRGSFTSGVRIMSGGPAREMPLDAEAVDHGKVLFVSSTLKPVLSGEARTNVVGGRPTERLGSRGGFTPGAKAFRGGAPRDVPLEAEFLDRGKVLFVSSTLKPDMSGEARTNAVRPTERLGSGGRFIPGARRWLGGRPRDVPLEAEITDHGKVLSVSSIHKPDLSYLPTFIVAGGRPDERCGTRGSFTSGVRIMPGGPAREMSLDAETVDHGKVLFVSSIIKPDLSREACTNVVGGRPTERLGSRGGFTPGARRWLGGEPRDIPAGRETTDHGIVLFPRQQRLEPSPVGDRVGGDGNVTGNGKSEGEGNDRDNDNDDNGDAWFFETEDITMDETCQAVDAALAWETTTAAVVARIAGTSSFNNLAEKGCGGVFRRCGSDSQFNAGAELMKDLCRPSF
eukprot:g6442.t1